MKTRRVVTYFFSLVLIGAVMFACSESVQSKANFIFKSAPKAGLVAKFDDTEIKESELYVGIESQLYEAQMKVYEIKMNRLKSLVLEKFIEKDPRKKGLSNDKFLEKYIIKSAKVTEKQIKQFIKEKNIPEKHVNGQMKQRIKQFLEIQSKKTSVEGWLAKQTHKTPVEVYLQKPNRPVHQYEVGKAPWVGGEKAKVTVIEVTDFQCPFCAKGSQVMKELKQKYGTKIKVVFKNFPLPFHTQAKQAAKAAFCANKQDKKYFWKMYYELFGNQANINPKGISAMAQKVGLDMKAYSSCMKTKEMDKIIDADIEQAKEAGVNSTPTFFVNGQMINGAQDLEVFTQIIDEELEK